MPSAPRLVASTRRLGQARNRAAAGAVDAVGLGVATLGWQERLVDDPGVANLVLGQVLGQPFFEFEPGGSPTMSRKRDHEVSNATSSANLPRQWEATARASSAVSTRPHPGLGQVKHVAAGAVLFEKPWPNVTRLKSKRLRRPLLPLLVETPHVFGEQLGRVCACARARLSGGDGGGGGLYVGWLVRLVVSGRLGTVRRSSAGHPTELRRISAVDPPEFHRSSVGFRSVSGPSARRRRPV
jgi:hypothetical protein